METIIQKVTQTVIDYMPKEYFCHIQFVTKVALEMQKIKGGDIEIITVASIAHDYGRLPEGDNTLHPEIGAEKTTALLHSLGYPPEQTQRVARCIMMHNKKEGFQSIEEEIVMNADQLSKVIYHEAFMLLVKKETFEERALWALKYLNKGYENTTFLDFKDTYTPLYQQKKSLFELILKK